MLRLLALGLACALLSGCGGGSAETASPQPARQDPVTDLENVLRLRADFEADAGKTRVLLLFSPT